jgi:plasmid stabilization system protein ParE
LFLPGNGGIQLQRQLPHVNHQECIQMPQGDNSRYTARQQRKAEHIEEGYEKRGVKKPEAKRRAWATVNKQEGGGNKPGGSGRGKTTTKASARKGGKKGGSRSASTSESRS